MSAHGDDATAAVASSDTDTHVSETWTTLTPDGVAWMNGPTRQAAIDAHLRMVESWRHIYAKHPEAIVEPLEEHEQPIASVQRIVCKTTYETTRFEPEPYEGPQP